MANTFDKALSFHQNALSVRSYRQQLLASNIANADTPHYKARDVNFQDSLRQALGPGGGGPLSLKRTSNRHLSGTAGSALDNAALYRSETQSSVDGNTVDLNVERAQFAENAVQYEASVTFVNGVLKTLSQAIQGQ